MLAFCSLKSYVWSYEKQFLYQHYYFYLRTIVTGTYNLLIEKK